MFYFPQVPELRQRWRASFKAEAGLDAATPSNNVKVTADVMAGGQSEDFGRLDYVGQQAFVLTADRDFLIRHAEQYGQRVRPAAAAAGYVTITTTGAISIPVGGRFTRADGWVYSASESGSLAGAGTINVAAVAISNPPISASGALSAPTLDGTGATGNADPGTDLEIGSDATGAGAATALAEVGPGGIIGGLDVEGTEDLRQRVLFRLRNPPHGGNAADYVLWTSTVPGVTRVFVERIWRGPGTVRVFPIFDTTFSGGVPDEVRVQSVADTLAALEPAVAIVTVTAAIPQIIDIEVSGLDPDTNDVRNAVVAELADAFLRLGRVSGSDKNIPGMPYLAWPFTLSLSWIWQAVANASGERRHKITSPTDDIVIAPGAIPVLGNVDFV
jgi:uncharacterized phage protein gp47/JayE